MARTTLVLGECARQQGETERAAAFFRRALEAATGAGLAPVVWQAHAGLASQEQGTPAADHARLARTVADALAASITEPALRKAFSSRTEKSLGQ